MSLKEPTTMRGRTYSLKSLIVASVCSFLVGSGICLLTAAQGDTGWGLLYQVLGIVRTQYVERELDDTRLIYGSIKGLLKSLEDPYTRFIEPKGFEDMKIHLNGNFAGVGIQIGMKDEQLTVINPIKGTPAEKAGIRALDKIMAIDGESTEDLSISESVSKIRGEKGSSVTLTILRGSQSEKLDFTIIRANVPLPSVYTKKIIHKPKKIGYIQLITFESKETYNDLIKALQELEDDGLNALILDLRNNGGGLLEEAKEVASIFLPEDKTIVHTINRYGNKETFCAIDSDYGWRKKPLVLLVNGQSASASEILAGAIENNKRGILIGTQTFGKALVQNIQPLSDGSAVLVTVAKYLTPDGSDINKLGITPNIIEEIPTAMVEESHQPGYTYSEDKDPQLQRAINYLTNKI